MELVTSTAMNEVLEELRLEDIPEKYHDMAIAVGFKTFSKLTQYLNGYNLQIQKSNYSKIYDQNRDLINVIGVKAFDQLAQFCGGGQIYIPKFWEVSKPARNRLIVAEFNGYNYFELAKKWNLTDRSIRNIIKHKSNSRRISK